MRVIFSDEANGNITADTADASYPVTNLSDPNPTSIWKATSQSATLTAAITGIGDMDVYLGAANDADSAVSYAYKNGAATVASGTMTYGGDNNYWCNAPGVTATSVVLTLDAGTGNISEAGILRVGEAIVTADPIANSVQMRIEDTSMVNQTRNLAWQYKQFQKTYSFSGRVIADVGEHAKIEFMDGLKAALPYPVAVKLFETNFQKSLFCRIEANASLEYSINNSNPYNWTALIDFTMSEVA